MLGFCITGAEIQVRGEEVVIEKWGLIVDYFVECWLMLWTAYSIEGDLKRAERARSFASISYRIVVGEDETFEETYGGKARVLIAQKKLWKSV